MPETTAEDLYAQMRVQGEVTIGEHLEHLAPKVRRLALKDGLIFGRATQRLGQRGWVGWEQKSISLFLHDGHGNLVHPDA